MFRLMGKTFYGESHVDPHVEPKIHESPRSMTVPLILLAIPSVLLGIAASACRSGDGRIQPAGWSRCSIESEEYARPAPRAEFELFGIDGALILMSVGAGRDRRSSLGIWLFGFFRRGGRIDTVRADHERQRRDPVPVPRLAQQVVVRRAQRPALHPLRRARRGGAVVVRRARHRRHGQRHRRR